MARLNPADPDYQIKRLLAKVSSTEGRQIRSESDSPGPPDPGDGSTESIAWHPVFPHVYVYTSATVNPNAHTIPIPVSTLMIPDPSGRYLTFPTLEPR